MNKNIHKREILVIKKPSQDFVNLMNKLRNRKAAQQEELRNKRGFYFPKK